MRPFYISRRSNGYYRVRFVDTVTKEMTVAKSTHKKTYDEALAVVCGWLQKGIPTTSKKNKHKETININKNNVEISDLDNLSDEQTFVLYRQLQIRLGLVSSITAVPVPQIMQTESAAPPKLKRDISGEKLTDWLYDFWVPEKSEYIGDKKDQGGSIGERHCYEMRNRIKTYWKPYFGDSLISEIDSEDLREFFRSIKRVQKLSGGTINKIMNAGAVAFKWAFEHKRLAENFALGLKRYAADDKERGILTNEETEKLFLPDWKDYRAKVANLLAMSTGMRAGEILALRPCDVRDTYINVTHSWSDKDGLKCPKNGKARKVPLVAGMREVLLKLAAQNPHGMTETSFIFYSTLPAQPIVINFLTENLAHELRNIGISEAERQERNIVFHSWRHYYATEITRRVEMAQAQQALGHLTPEMTRHYADHKSIEDLEVIGVAANEAFANVIAFSKIA